MVKRSEFERGDIMLVGFDPASGHEQRGAGRPVLVLSVQAFNQLGMTLVAPITQGGNFARYAGFSVPLRCEEGDVCGVVVVNQVRMMDLNARQAKRIGLACDEVVEEVLLRLQAVVE
ncbi:type II toxin-antitoxin system ChpB family toxin [Escherichia albertii]|uniref:type II toxin-antitoxin system ChpB family toxin n=1 Tax=Escherichia albertii TaxID=208962 RepID=UPI000743626C|nr:type II toxin-antitoxin system ChpB family toxin [Escherichia albertii]EFB1500718.1 type II toxin-antitoxin system ChpB family toxin [Escherichia albertii]EFF0785164.1 type II toxin-antitoxin system ChpB family toxin [Escherichia albertii]EJM0809281.1 type II toxin-antitoxin system ChpB family toxin [Escherichia albertii]EJM1767200.1 type II toxin-antitoxin system ChpB family toxin [Escherichia albertii]EJM2113988.1 type II toxin-antitoxin system ChpB family toxin [Escherichia albertii]